MRFPALIKGGLFFLILVLLVLGMMFCNPSGRESAKMGGSLESAKLSKEAEGKIGEVKSENNHCLHCHGTNKVVFENDSTGEVFIQKMYNECVIDTVAYYTSNHWNFKCTDCHPEEYSKFPHDPELRFTAQNTCLDCHPTESPDIFHFEKIQLEFDSSVHSSRHSADFSCWSCHDSHYYKINARNRKQDLKKTIEYDNAICLSCHEHKDKYQLIFDTVNPDISQIHQWLPNQPNHFLNVRCIECHAEINDTLLVAHKILPKGKAVKRCVDCHSKDSRLKASLYKYRLESGSGFFRDENVGEAVLIGTNRSTSVNIISNIFIILTVIGLGIHATLRIITRKR